MTDKIDLKPFSTVNIFDEDGAFSHQESWRRCQAINKSYPSQCNNTIGSKENYCNTHKRTINES
jgi:hypothetical protein